MFTIYYANQLEMQKDLLLGVMEHQPLSDPFMQDVVLVQSPGMAQWLQLNIAEKFGIAANIAFPMPASFIWQLYCSALDNIPEMSDFQKELMVWHLVQVIPNQLEQPAFISLRSYLGEEVDQVKLYQLAQKIADLFDQYLVYRPDWLALWEQEKETELLEKFAQKITIKTKGKDKQQPDDILIEVLRKDIKWQATLWRALLQHITALNQERNAQYEVWHRAKLHQFYLANLQISKPKNLPQRIFVFGISALPKMFLETLQAIAKYCDVHLFFNSPSCYYWGDIVDPSYLIKLKQKKLAHYKDQQSRAWFATSQIAELENNHYQTTIYDESLQVGHPLLATWGKLGRDFLFLLAQTEANQIDAYVEPQGESLLCQLQRQIYQLSPTNTLHIAQNDQSLSFHRCYSAMREVEVLHNHLLNLFENDRSLLPKNVVVMVPNIEYYQPYIQAVFSQYHAQLGDKRAIPYAISDQKVSESDVLIATFLQLFKLREHNFEIEFILELLEVEAIYRRFDFEREDLAQVKDWLNLTNTRFGLHKDDMTQTNYNSWQSSLQRMLLGYAWREQDGIWQDTLGFDFSSGLQAKNAGNLCHFIQVLQTWQSNLLQPNSPQYWQDILLQLVQDIFIQDSTTMPTILLIEQAISQLFTSLQQVNFTQDVEAEVILSALQSQLNEQVNSVRFLMGQVNFCTLLPMRAVPFKVICLLGMNEEDFPRQLSRNSFDLMQYCPEKGDRSKREDDSYLFLEALLSAREKLYISYVGRSIIDNSERNPSVFVSQLLDYLSQASTVEAVKALQFDHPMTVFSPNNFIAPAYSYAKEWLPVAEQIQHHQIIGEPFNQPLPVEINIEDRTLELAELIKFIQSPIKYFFENQLDVYFPKEEDDLLESENFSLDALENYLVAEDLLSSSDTEWPDTFAIQKHRGVLPRANFAVLTEEKVIENILPLARAVKPYQQLTAEIQEINYQLDLGDNRVQITGTIQPLYQQQYVKWRAGKCRDRDLLALWVIYVLQQANSESAVPAPRLFVRAKSHEVQQITFKPISQQQAKQQLTLYVEAYLAGEKNVQIVPTEDIKIWCNEANNGELGDEILCLEKLMTQSNNSYDGTYWQRILPQLKLDVDQLKQNIEQWFGLLFTCREEY